MVCTLYAHCLHTNSWFAHCVHTVCTLIHGLHTVCTLTVCTLFEFMGVMDVVWERDDEDEVEDSVGDKDLLEQLGDHTNSWFANCLHTNSWFAHCLHTVCTLIRGTVCTLFAH
jgi:hypothetical protein